MVVGPTPGESGFDFSQAVRLSSPDDYDAQNEWREANGFSSIIYPAAQEPDFDQRWEAVPVSLSARQDFITASPILPERGGAPVFMTPMDRLRVFARSVVQILGGLDD